MRPDDGSELRAGGQARARPEGETQVREVRGAGDEGEEVSPRGGGAGAGGGDFQGEVG